MLSFLDKLVFILDSVLIPSLVPSHNGLQVFGIKLLLTISKIEDDFATFLTQVSNHEYDLEGHAERVAREGELVKQSTKSCIV